MGYSPGCSEVEAGPDAPCHPEQLLSVLQVFGQALLQQDINVFRLSLAALEDLNAKWKLYHKVRKLTKDAFFLVYFRHDVHEVRIKFHDDQKQTRHQHNKKKRRFMFVDKETTFLAFQETLKSSF